MFAHASKQKSTFECKYHEFTDNKAIVLKSIIVGIQQHLWVGLGLFNSAFHFIIRRLVFDKTTFQVNLKSLEHNYYCIIFSFFILKKLRI